MGYIYRHNPNSEIISMMQELEHFPPHYCDPKTVKLKINAEYVNYNIAFECYRERMVNFMYLLPLMKKQVALEEADYILYMHSYARVDDMGWVAKKDLLEIDARRKPGAEIVVIGKACNVRDILDCEIKNITYFEDNFIKKVGRKFGQKKICGAFAAFDDDTGKLSIWPVDGCKNKCAFCRRTYMHIPFHSVSIERIQRLLDWTQKNYPEWLKIISLRAENITEYGLDLYGERCFYKVLELMNNYPEIEVIECPIGICIGELSEKDIEALCKLKADISMLGINLEVGTDRLLELIKKPHTVAQAVKSIEQVRSAHPELHHHSTVMVGIPTETLKDIDTLADLLVDLEVDNVMINKCGISKRCPLAAYPQLSPSLVEYHQTRLVQLLKQAGRDVREGKRSLKKLHQCPNGDYEMTVYHEEFFTKAKRRWHRCQEKNNTYCYDYPVSPRKYEHISFC